MKVTACRKTKAGQVVYGLRVHRCDRADYLATRPSHIDIDIDGRQRRYKLSQGFWSYASVLYDPLAGPTPIRDWLSVHHGTEWPTHQPPRFKLHVLGENRFRLGD